MAKTNLENAQSLLTKINTYARLWRFTCTLVQQPTWYESPLMRNTMFSQPQTLNESSAQQWAQATAQRRSRAWGHRLTSHRLRLGRLAQVTNGQGPNGLHEPRATSSTWTSWGGASVEQDPPHSLPAKTVAHYGEVGRPSISHHGRASGQTAVIRCCPISTHTVL